MVNPFSTKTPEELEVEEVLALFVDVFIDLPQIDQIGHTFIHGTRGSGKSMMFKYMLPDVQLALLRQSDPNRNLQQIPYYAILLPVKTDIAQAHQISTLEVGKSFLAAHFMNLKALEVILESLRKNFLEITANLKDSQKLLDSFYYKFINLCNDWGIKLDLEKIVYSNFDSAYSIIYSELVRLNRYLGLRGLGNDEPYPHSLTNFRDFTIPIIKEIKKFIPQNIYLMVDDADNLSIELQEVLNTWVSHRMTDVLSLKISTQLRYSTYKTSASKIIEVPHDFNEVDLTQIYTSNVNNYLSRAEKIIEKRLQFHGIPATPYEFFQEDEKQKENIIIESEVIRKNHQEGLGISRRVGDDIYRYAIPSYMTKLQKTKKSNTFSYSGFRTLVNISSGTIRYFLEPAERMYSQMESMTEKGENITSIPPILQNSIIRDWSDEFIYNRLPKLESLSLKDAENFLGLRNLIKSLGDLFAKKLLDQNSSERRIFSIFTDHIPTEVDEIIELGVSYGYLQKSSIHSKEKTGRKIEIILTRCLAPHYYLDPTGYSGRLSVTPAALILATRNPSKFVRERLKEPEEIDLTGTLFEGL